MCTQRKQVSNQVTPGASGRATTSVDPPLPDDPTYPPTATLRILSLCHKEHRHAVARGKAAKASGRHLLVLGNELSVVVVGRVPVDLRATTLRSHQTHTPNHGEPFAQPQQYHAVGTPRDAP